MHSQTLFSLFNFLSFCLYICLLRSAYFVSAYTGKIDSQCICNKERTNRDYNRSWVQNEGNQQVDLHSSCHLVYNAYSKTMTFPVTISPVIGIVMPPNLFVSCVVSSFKLVFSHSSSSHRWTTAEINLRSVKEGQNKNNVLQTYLMNLFLF